MSPEPPPPDGGHAPAGSPPAPGSGWPAGYTSAGYPSPGGHPSDGPASTSPRQHAYRPAWGTRAVPGAGDRQGRAAPGRSPRSLLWLVVVVVVVVALLRAHRISGTEVILFCVLVPSLVLHEISHGLVALACGDDTARRAGRLSLNPLRHVDVVGTLVVPAITILAGWGYFGWAKPVPVNVSKLRSPRNEGVLVSLAGPVTNLVLAALLGLLFYVAFAAGHSGPVPTTLPARIVFDAGVINLWVAAFNLVPIPPLDGSALVERLLPAAWWPEYLRLRPYGLVVILGAVLLLSWVHVYPLQAVFDHLYTWWGHVIHAF